MPFNSNLSDFMNYPTGDTEDNDSSEDKQKESGELDLNENELEMGDDYIADALAALEKYPDTFDSDDDQNHEGRPQKSVKNDALFEDTEDISEHSDYKALQKRINILENKLKKKQQEFRKKLDEREHDLREAGKVVKMLRSASNELRKRIEDTKQEADEFKRKWQQTVSSYVNFQEHSRKKRNEFVEMEKANILRQFLPVIDNMRRPLDYDKPSNSIIEGVKMTYQLCEDFLLEMNVQKIPSVGEKFDPNNHEAVERVPSDDVPENTIIEELEPGYYLDDKVLRPAKVSVSYILPDKTGTKEPLFTKKDSENTIVQENKSSYNTQENPDKSESQEELSEGKMLINDGKTDLISIESDRNDVSSIKQSMNSNFADDVDYCEEDEENK
jgi:molecular chaperone GrpE